MTDAGSVRSSRIRRLIVAIARATALFILVAGIYGAAAIARPQSSVLVRSIVALGIGVVIFEMLRPARRAITVPVEGNVVVDNSAELAEAREMIDLLRVEIGAARDRESEIRQQYERESEHLQRAASRALDEIQRIRAAHDEARGQLDSERTKSSDAERRIASAAQELEALRADRQRALRDLEQARQKSDAAETKLGDLQKELDLTRSASQQLVQANEALKSQIDEERQRLQAELQRVSAEAKKERDRMQAEARTIAGRSAEMLAQLERERKLSQELGATRARLDEEKVALKKARDAAAAEREAALKARDVALSDRDSAAMTRDAALAQADSLRQRIEQIARDHDAARQQLERDHASSRQTLESELTAKHQRAVAALAADHDATLKKTREAAVAEISSLRKRIEQTARDHDTARQQLERDHASARQQLETDLTARHQSALAALAADHEAALRAAIDERERARAETRTLQDQIAALEAERNEAAAAVALSRAENDDLRQQLVDARKQLGDAREQLANAQQQVADGRAEHDRALEQLEEAWSGKLQKIVNGLTADHENDIGEAIAKREEARAEVRSLNLKITKLEDHIEQMKTQLETHLQPVDEKALREKIDAEWSAKLQTIVSHIASDHDADVGKAIEEREAARAEVRNLTLKVTALSQKVEAERQRAEALQSRLRESDSATRNAPTQPMPALRESGAASREPEAGNREPGAGSREPEIVASTPDSQPPTPAQEDRARADVLEFAEQAFEALRRATSPGTVPVPATPAPAEERQARILIVHHDPALRGMWREALTKAGFAVLIAADGLEGLRVAKGEKPDVVIADVSMPKMGGRELCQLIKSNPETSDVKVILLTGVYTNEVPLDAETKQIEADEMLRKPVKLEAMKTAVSQVLAARVAS